MKIDYGRVFVPFGKDSKKVGVNDLELGDLKLGDLLAHVHALQTAYDSLVEQLKTCHIVKKDTDYIIEVDNELKRVKDLKLVADTRLEMPLKFYKIEDGNIVVDKKKVGRLL
jgi:hypothetical protein